MVGPFCQINSDYFLCNHLFLNNSSCYRDIIFFVVQTLNITSCQIKVKLLDPKLIVVFMMLKGYLLNISMGVVDVY